MAPFTAPVLVACLLLVVAGTLKVRRPALTTGALRSVGVRLPAWFPRVLGAVEVALGTATALTGRPVLLALVAAAYTGFSVFVAVALRKGGAVASCGCVGRPDTPPTHAHVAVTAALAVASAVAAGHPTDTTALAGHPLTAHTATLLALTALAGWLTWLVLAVLPLTRIRPDRPEA